MTRLSLEHGYTLIEVSAVLAVLGIVVLAGLGAASRDAATVSSSSVAFKAALANARALAATTGDGATLLVAPAPHGSRLATFAHRPIDCMQRPCGEITPRADIPALAVEARISATMPEDGATDETFAIFVESSGAATAARWAAGSPPLAREPFCSDRALPTLTFAAGPLARTHPFTCQRADVQLDVSATAGTRYDSGREGTVGVQP